MQARKSVPLHVHLWLLFGSLVLAVGALTCGINFFMTKTALEAAASDAVHRISRETLDEVGELIVPAQMVIKLVSHSSLADAPTTDARLARLALLRDALDTSPVLQSLYLGYADGSFFYFRALRGDADRALFDAPEKAAYAVRSVERGGSAQSRGRLYFLDASLGILHSVDDHDFARKFDPRQRTWYQDALSSGGMVRTEPYLFFSDNEAGATVAIPTARRDAVVGGDFRLDSLGNMLARKTTMARSLLALLDSNGRIVAIDRKFPDSASAPDTIRTEVLVMPGDFGIPILTRLAARIAAHGAPSGRQELMRAGDEDWYTTVDLLTPAGGKPLYLLAAIPQDELLKTAKQRAWIGMGATVAVVLLSLPLIWLAARYFSRPLHDLAGSVEALRRFDFRQPIAVQSRISELNALASATEDMRQTVQRFVVMVQAISAESRLEQLLPVLLRKMLNAAGGSAGALYLADGEALSVAAALDCDGTSVSQAMPPSPIRQSLPLVRAAAAVLAPQTGQLTPEDIRAAKLELLASDAPCYAAAIPLATRQQELQGLILVLRDTPIDPARLAFVGTLASLCAGALEVRALTQAQRNLFDALIRMMAGAIDAKSPHTGGHCERVPELAKLLARAACDATDGPYRSFQMTEAQWEALNVAAWLHDCGKVTTPEYIIDKATKLETLCDRIHEVRMRFEVLKRDAEIACLRAISAGEEAGAARQRRDAELAALDDDFAFVAACNQGGEFMDAPQKERLMRIAERTWLRTLDDRLGISQEELARKAHHPAAPVPAVEPLLADKPEHAIARGTRDIFPADNPWGFRLNTPTHLYNRGELHNLLVSRGTLSEEERFKIEEHIVQTQVMLSRLPFPRHLRQVPEIAGNHHEKMDGTGYPRRLHGSEMSPLARMMAIADIFEALTAADRPYKKAKSLSESVRIMATAAAQQHIDPQLFELFLTSGVYLRYAERFMRPDQIDAVDIAQYTGRGAQQGTATA
ncbi:HD domain-containing phosphohydrolase [Cupriavidus oxalaticus]|uniref:HD domain-containing phosphohydrolase n=1 Tax=Cupriavidus oxalaticus TaxID=96344 RepID=UPI003179EEB2